MLLRKEDAVIDVQAAGITSCRELRSECLTAVAANGNTA